MWKYPCPRSICQATDLIHWVRKKNYDENFSEKPPETQNRQNVRHGAAAVYLGLHACTFPLFLPPSLYKNNKESRHEALPEQMADMHWLSWARRCWHRSWVGIFQLFWKCGPFSSDYQKNHCHKLQRPLFSVGRHCGKTAVSMLIWVDRSSSNF